MKGVNQVFEHSLFLFIGLVAMGLIVASISAYLFTTGKNLVTTELNYVADKLAYEISEIYALANSESLQTTVRFSIPISEKIGSNKYLIELKEKTLYVTGNLQNEKIVVTRGLNFDANVTGLSYLPASIFLEKHGGNITIRLV